MIDEQKNKIYGVFVKLDGLMNDQMIDIRSIICKVCRKILILMEYCLIFCKTHLVQNLSSCGIIISYDFIQIKKA